MAQEVVVQKHPQNWLNCPELEGFVGIVFDEKYRIRELISDEFHFLSFAVDTITIPGFDRDPNKDRNPYTFQARVYNFNDLSPKVKSYRSRNLERISKRAVLTEDWNDRVVTIFRCDSVGTKTRKELAKHPLTDVREPTTTKPQKASQGPRALHANAPSASKPKSYYKRESDRLRQRDRRAAKKQQHRELGGVAPKPGVDVDAHTQSPKIDKTFGAGEAPISNQYALRIIQLNSNPRPIIQSVLRFRLQQAMMGYRQSHPLKTLFNIENDILEYIKIISKDLVEIRRLNKKRRGLQQECDDKLEQLRKQQILHYAKGIGEWGQLEQYNLERQYQWHRLLLVAAMKLPAVAEERKTQISILKRDISSLNQRQQTIVTAFST